MTRKLSIFYRHVHQKAEKRSRDPDKRRPSWFSYESCFKNLIETILNDPLRNLVELTLMFDGSLDDFQEDFSSKYISNSPIRINVLLFAGGSDEKSAITTLSCINSSQLQTGDIYYILENDYVHAPGWVSKVFELYNSDLRFDYVSLYDHRDKYFLPMYSSLMSKLLHTSTHHWRTAPSTCGSFLGEISLFRADYDVFCRALKDYFLFDFLVNQRGRVLVTPIPGLSTHCMEGYLSPAVHWEQYIE